MGRPNPLREEIVLVGTQALSSPATDREWEEAEARFVHALLRGDEPYDAFRGLSKVLFRRWGTPLFLMLDGGNRLFCEGFGRTPCDSVLQRICRDGWPALLRLYREPDWQSVDIAPCLSGFWVGLVESLGDPLAELVWVEPVKGHSGEVVGLLGQCLPRTLWRNETRREDIRRAAHLAGYLTSVVGTPEVGMNTALVLAAQAHALRTPLNAILGYGELLAEDLEADGQSARAEDARQITQAGRRLMVMLQDVVDFAKWEAGRLQPSPVTFELSEELGALSRNLNGELAGRGNRLVVEGAGEMYQDPDLFRRLLVHMVAYANRRVRDTRLQLRVEEQGDEVVSLALIDGGEAEEEGVQECILQGGVPWNEGGAGQAEQLDLPLIWRLAKVLGGEITWLAPPEAGVLVSLPKYWRS